MFQWAVPDRWGRAILVGVAVLLFGFAIVQGAMSVVAGWNTEAGEGVVVAIEVLVDTSTGRKHTTHLPTVRYVVGTTAHQCVGTWGNPKIYELEERVPIRYKVDRPEVGFIDTLYERWYLAIAAAVVGCVLTWPLLLPGTWRGR